MKMEPFVRALVDGCRIKPAPPDSYNKLRQQLSAIGNNLNQLTHVANATGRVSAPQLDRAQSLLEDNPVVFLPTPHGLLPMKCTPEQYEQFQRDGNKLKIKPIDHGER